MHQRLDTSNNIYFFSQSPIVWWTMSYSIASILLILIYMNVCQVSLYAANDNQISLLVSLLSSLISLLISYHLVIIMVYDLLKYIYSYILYHQYWLHIYTCMYVGSIYLQYSVALLYIPLIRAYHIDIFFLTDKIVFFV